MEERYALHLAITGASINALGELGASTATTELIGALYRTPELAMQVRRALVAAGPTAKTALEQVLLGKHAEIEALIRDRKLHRYCGDHGELPENQCTPLGLRDFYAALVLGDFHDPASATALLAALERPAAPAYFLDDLPGPVQHQAVFDALRKLGAPAAAAPLHALVTKRSTDLATKAMAASAYAFAARDRTGLRELGNIMSDNNENDDLRQQAASSYARLASQAGDIAPLLALAKKYLDASAKKRTEAERERKTKEAADADLEKERRKLDAMKDALLALTQDPNSTAEQITAETAKVKRADDDFKRAKKAHRDKTMPFRVADDAATAYLGFARLFQTHVARVEVAVRCKQDLACFADTLKLDGDGAARNVKQYIPDVDKWTADEKLGLFEANVDRAMLELGKGGAKAAAWTELLLAHVKTDNRMIRQAILLALPKVAPRPCPTCVTKLDEAIAAGEGKTTLRDLHLETMLLRIYFNAAK
jgi:hypothetical protein